MEDEDTIESTGPSGLAWFALGRMSGRQDVDRAQGDLNAVVAQNQQLWAALDEAKIAIARVKQELAAERERNHRIAQSLEAERKKTLALEAEVSSAKRKIGALEKDYWNMAAIYVRDVNKNETDKCASG